MKIVSILTLCSVLSLIAAQDTSCGNLTLTGENGTITSPNYPNDYPNDSSCLWEITVDQTKTIEIKFNFFQLEYDSFCQYDSLEIFEESSSQIMHKLCGKNIEYVLSSGNVLNLRFTSDYTVTDKGFELTWRSLSIDTKQTSGVITSPNYPNLYSNNANEIQQIEVASNHWIEFVFNDVFGIEGGTEVGHCPYDFIEVMWFEDNSQLANSDRICGKQKPSNITIPTNNVYFQFKTDKTVQDIGFYATWRQIPGYNWNISTTIYSTTTTFTYPVTPTYPSNISCGNLNLTGQNGIITSPNYPSNYPNNAYCHWMITVAENMMIGITFTFFEVEYHGACVYDSLVIYEENENEITHKLCGTASVPDNIMSTSNVLNLKFKSDSVVTYTGFFLTWSATNGTHENETNPETECGDLALTGQGGTILSPNYPNHYPNNAYCHWTITVDQNKTIALKFNSFQLEDSYNCDYDSLTIYESVETDILHTLCGVNIVPISSASTVLNLIFTSDSIITFQGFDLTWGQVEKPQTSGVITSPNYPNFYPNNVNEIQRIEVASNHWIEFVFNDVFGIEEGTDQGQCPYDYVEIMWFQGDSHLANTKRYCGSEKPVKLVVPSNSLSVQFKSDSNIKDIGFALNWRQISALPSNDTNPDIIWCGESELNGESGIITSPNYPDYYPNNAYCHWRITAKNDTMVIRIHFKYFDVEENVPYGCYDSLTIYDGNQTNNLCGNNLDIPPITSTGNILELVFQSDSVIQRNGFEIAWKTLSIGHENETGEVIPCGDLGISGETGTIISPNYPDNYPNNAYCHWRITVEENKGIEIKFASFRTENCLHDKLQIFGHNESEVVYQLCELTVVPISSTSNVMNLVFTSDFSVNYQGFNLTWRSIPIGTIPNSGVISSPNYPNLYANNANEMQHIEVAFNHWIELVFTDAFGIEGVVAEQCPHDYIEVMWFKENSQLTQTEKYCGYSRPGKVVLPSSSIFIQFKSDFDVQDIGFSLTWKQIPRPTGCTGEVVIIEHQNNGTISSPTYPLKFQIQTECVWQIIGPPGTYIAMSFKDFEILANNNYYESCSSATYMEIYDGNIVTNNSVLYLGQQHCGIRPPRGFRTTGNSLAIKFVTDGNTEFKGFLLEWRVEEECPENQFTCWNGSCISDSLVCDGNNDCASGYDEMNCPTSHSCGVQEIKPNFKWHARVVGGYTVVPHSWPWQGNLRIEEYDGHQYFTCGTTLIAEQWALTAAHCVDSSNRMFVYFGGHSLSTLNNETEQIFEVDQIHVHPHWTGNLIEGVDIALLHFKEKAVFNTYVQPVCLSINSTMDPGPKTPSVVTGWGQMHQSEPLYPDLMQQGVVPILSPDDCVLYQNQYPSLINATEEEQMGIREGHICVGYIRDNGGVGPCYGDSGGALVYFKDERWIQVGITSWGEKCAGSKQPGYYTRVSYHYQNFILPLLENGYHNISMNSTKPGSPNELPNTTQAPTTIDTNTESSMPPSVNSTTERDNSTTVNMEHTTNHQRPGPKTTASLQTTSSSIKVQITFTYYLVLLCLLVFSNTV